MGVKRGLCSLVVAAALPAFGQQGPPLEPLLPPKAPWLTNAPPAQQPAKKKKKKARPPAAQLPLPPLAAPGQPPLTKPSNDIGVLVLNDGLDTAALLRVAEGMRGVARLASSTRTVRLVGSPAQSCADDACWVAWGADLKLDLLLVAKYGKDALEVRLVDVPARRTTGSAAQSGVPADAAFATAAAEALACKLLVPAGCFVDSPVDASGVQVELDGRPLKTGDKVAVGLHALTARAGEKIASRSLPVLREGTPPVYARLIGGEPELLDAAPAASLPLAALVPAPAPAPSQRRWTKPAGYAALGLGAVAAGAGIYFGAKSRSELNDAENAYRTNGGAYQSGDASLLSSGNSKAHSANALFAASAVLLVAGAVLTFAF